MGVSSFDLCFGFDVFFAQHIKASFAHYNRTLSSLGYISIHTSGFLSVYTRWFIRFVRVYFQEKHNRTLEILAFVDMDRGGFGILHQLNRHINSAQVSVFESNVKFPTKWASLRYSYLSHLMSPTTTMSSYGQGAGLELRKDINIMTYNKKTKDSLEKWRDMYSKLSDPGNEWLLWSVQTPNDNGDQRTRVRKCMQSQQEIQFMLDNGISSIAAVPVDHINRDMQKIIDEAI